MCCVPVCRCVCIRYAFAFIRSYVRVCCALRASGGGGNKKWYRTSTNCVDEKNIFVASYQFGPVVCRLSYITIPLHFALVFDKAIDRYRFSTQLARTLAEEEDTDYGEYYCDGCLDLLQGAQQDTTNEQEEFCGGLASDIKTVMTMSTPRRQFVIGNCIDLLQC